MLAMLCIDTMMAGAGVLTWPIAKDHVQVLARMAQQGAG